MSEYLYAEIHETEDTMEIRFLYEESKYALVMGHELFDLLRVAPGQRSPVLMEVLVYDD